jgi:hypothetical protein
MARSNLSNLCNGTNSSTMHKNHGRRRQPTPRFLSLSSLNNNVIALYLYTRQCLSQTNRHWRRASAAAAGIAARHHHHIIISYLLFRIYYLRAYCRRRRRADVD